MGKIEHITLPLFPFLWITSWQEWIITKNMQRANENARIFTETGVQNLVAFSETLRHIHARLIMEGYVLEKGRIVKRASHQATNSDILKE